VAAIEESLAREVPVPLGRFAESGKVPRISTKTLSPRKRLVYGTALAVLVLCMLFTLILVQIIVGGPQMVCESTAVSSELLTAFLTVLGWIAGTYFGRSG